MGGQEVGDVNWSAFILPGRIARQCNNRLKKLINRKVNKGSMKKGGWTKDEDQQILEHGTSEGDKDWQSLAENLPGLSKSNAAIVSNVYRVIKKEAAKNK